ncbi:hypothetical protein GF420_03660 [candidate division GN15 bacterium]|nr:hypothetical protein [candidate division GN15 bacterium]
MSTKELQEKLVANMERWQKVEDTAVKTTEDIANKTNNPVVKHVMKIIKRDSEMHKLTQQLIIDTLQGTYTMTPDELADVWGSIEKHIETELQTIELAKEAKAYLKDKKMTVQEYLVEYLLVDEEKHNALLEQLATIKKGMYPYGS